MHAVVYTVNVKGSLRLGHCCVFSYILLGGLDAIQVYILSFAVVICDEFKERIVCHTVFADSAKLILFGHRVITQDQCDIDPVINLAYKLERVFLWYSDILQLPQGENEFFWIPKQTLVPAIFLLRVVVFG